MDNTEIPQEVNNKFPNNDRFRDIAYWGYHLRDAEVDGLMKEIKYAEKVAYETSKTNADLMAKIEGLSKKIEKNSVQIFKLERALKASKSVADQMAELVDVRDKEIERLKDLFVKYESWEADIISNDEMWWPNKAKDSLPDEIYNKMLELQAERNELLNRFTPESYKK